MNNPYIVGRPLFNPENFYGRKEEVKEIFADIKNLIPISLVGTRGIGLTSLLRFISHPSVVRKYLNIDHYIMTYIDFAVFGQYSKEQFWREILNQMNKSAKKSKRMSIMNFLRDKGSSIQDIYRIFEDLSSNDISAVFCFDGFEKVKRNPNFDRHFFDNLRHFVTAYSNITYITATRKKLGDLNLPTDILSSPLFTYFISKRIGFLEEKETKDLILKPSEREGVQLNEDDVNFVFDVAYCHPFFVQSTCHEIFQYRRRKSKIHGEKMEQNTYEEIKKTLYQNFKNYFDYYWKLLDYDQRKGLKSLCKCDTRLLEDEGVISSLEGSCLIRKNSSGFLLFSSLFRKFCIKKKIWKEPFG